jgi:hypothetical protein
MRSRRPLAFLLLWLCASCTPVAQLPSQPTASPSASEVAPPATAVITPASGATALPLPSAELEGIQSQVERLRGIEARQDIRFTATTQDEINSLTREAWLLDWPLSALEREVQLLDWFGLSAPPTDVDVLMSAVGLDGALVAPATDSGLAVSADLGTADADRLQVVCAYERLLLTQAFPSTEPPSRAEACLADIDACLAKRALSGGDAELLGEQWSRTFGSSPSTSARISACGLPQATAGIDSPLVSVLTFAHEYGSDFARALYLKAGWAGVDQAYASPPVSTEQILHPERYPKDVPRPPGFADPAAGLGTDWTTEDSGTLGEWRTRLILQAHLDAQQAALAAEGWDGDHYALLSNAGDGSRALVLLTRYDTVRDAHEFSGAFRTYGENRFGPGKRTGTALTWTTPSGIVVLDVGNDQTLWIEAPDATAAAALRKASGFPLY